MGRSMPAVPDACLHQNRFPDVDVLARVRVATVQAAVQCVTLRLQLRPNAAGSVEKVCICTYKGGGTVLSDRMEA
jgi:hypothetical protein